MTDVDEGTAELETGPLCNPWPFLLAGLGAISIVLAWCLVAPGWATPARLILLFLGLVAVLGGLSIRPSSALVWWTSSGTLLLAAFSLDPAWDTIRLLFRVLAAVAAAAGIIVLLPRVVRRLVFSLLVVFHFGGILTAITSVPPSPWLSTVVWTYVYRPYLQFIYMNNAYHFYSPDPGPACLLWCRLEYADGSRRWVKFPTPGDYATKVGYQRRLSLTESVNQVNANPNAQEFLLRKLARDRVADQIPYYPYRDVTLQYREPQPHVKKLLASYARHLARHYPHLHDPTQPVTGVRIYRVIHQILTAKDFANGEDPLDPRSYEPYYQGEFDREGNLKDPNDPLLYWLIPIFNQPQTALPGGAAAGARSEIIDGLKIHAGPYVDQPGAN